VGGWVAAHTHVRCVLVEGGLAVTVCVACTLQGGSLACVDLFPHCDGDAVWFGILDVQAVYAGCSG
jgi:hypothetical protein